VSNPLSYDVAAAREADLQRLARRAERQGRWSGPRGRATSLNRRSDLLAVIAAGATPWRDTRGLWQTFTDLDDLLLSAQQSWLAALNEALGAITSEAPSGREVATLRAYVAMQTRLPGLAALLNEHEERLMIAAGIRSEHRMVARAAGISDATVLLAQARAAAMGLIQEPVAEPVRAPDPAASSVRVPGPRRPVLNRVVGVLQRTAH